MKNFKTFIQENTKYHEAGIDVNDVKAKMKHHNDESNRLSKEITKHKKTSKEYRSLNNDITHHDNARRAYDEAHYRIKKNFAPSSVKEKIKSAEKHSSKISGIIPKVAKSKNKIKNIHDHVHKMLTANGFEHSSEKREESTHSIKRMTPYGDDRAFSQRGKRTNTVHSYMKKGTPEEAKHIEKTLKKDDVLGERGNHYVSVHHSKGKIHVTHHITGKSSPDHDYNEREYNHASGAGADPVHWGTRYHSWRKNY